MPRTETTALLAVLALAACASVDPRPDYEMSPASLKAVDEYWHRYKTAMSAQR